MLSPRRVLHLSGAHADEIVTNPVFDKQVIRSIWPIERVSDAFMATAGLPRPPRRPLNFIGISFYVDEKDGNNRMRRFTIGILWRVLLSCVDLHDGFVYLIVQNRNGVVNTLIDNG